MHGLESRSFPFFANNPIEILSYVKPCRIYWAVLKVWERSWAHSTCGGRCSSISKSCGQRGSRLQDRHPELNTQVITNYHWSEVVSEHSSGQIHDPPQKSIIFTGLQKMISRVKRSQSRANLSWLRVAGALQWVNQAAARSPGLHLSGQAVVVNLLPKLIKDIIAIIFVLDISNTLLMINNATKPITRTRLYIITMHIQPSGLHILGLYRWCYFSSGWPSPWLPTSAPRSVYSQAHTGLY